MRINVWWYKVHKYYPKFGNIFPENSIAPLQVLPFREAFIYVEEFNVYKT
jgi:hypothetical protein